tara:strand:- start:102 stop:548 length:447 start_codon:yes stop_codon:yes gene_type:complete
MNIDIKNKPLPVEVLIVDPPGVKEGTVVNLLTGKRLLNSAPVVKSLKFRGYHKGDYYVDGDRVLTERTLRGALVLVVRPKCLKRSRLTDYPLKKPFYYFNFETLTTRKISNNENCKTRIVSFSKSQTQEKRGTRCNIQGDPGVRRRVT